jgi:hypothetical protein
VGWSSFTLGVTPKHSGYRFDRPSTWRVQPLDAQCGKWAGPAVFVANVRFVFKEITGPDMCGDQWDFTGLPRDAVAIDLDPQVVGPPLFQGSPGPMATRFPIDFDERGPSPAPAPTVAGPVSFAEWQLPLFHDGWPPYRVRVFVGPDASAEDRAIAHRIVRSIRAVRFRG